MSSKMTDSMTPFRLTGRFLGFLPGEKSPYQMISLAASPDGCSQSAEAGNYQVVLGKQLRRMMHRYLEPQDWIGVVGYQGINLRSGQMEWKADEILKLSARQVAEYQTSVRQPVVSSPTKAATKPVRILICQKSDCQRRGSEAVSQVLKEAIARTEAAQKVVVQSTGCMKRCKVGPNVVMLPGGAHSEVSVERARSLIETLL